MNRFERAVSKDFVNWKREGLLDFGDGGPTPTEQFYVNQIKPYYRAPHILIGFPARYVDRGITVSTDKLPEPEDRKIRIASSPRHGTAVTDSVLITSRDGKTFRRSNDVFLRPGLRTRYNWSYGDNYIARHVVETESTDDDSPREMSLYATEAYFTGNFSRLRRYSLRLDGFVSAHAKYDAGELITKAFTFEGKRLSLNYRTSAAGFVKLELQTADGTPVPGFTLDDADITSVVAASHLAVLRPDGWETFVRAEGRRPGFELGEGPFCVRAVRLVGLAGTLTWPTQPDHTFAHELAGRVRVVAGLDQQPIMFHSEKWPDYADSNRELRRIRTAAGCGPQDSLVVVWGAAQSSVKGRIVHDGDLAVEQLLADLVSQG